MPGFAGFLQGKDIETRRDLGLLDEAALAREREERSRYRQRLVEWLSGLGLLEAPASDVEVLRAALTCLGASSAQLTLVSLDDLLGETEPQNVPCVPLSETAPRQLYETGQSASDWHMGRQSPSTHR